MTNEIIENPVPIEKGGTGGGSIEEALFNLSALGSKTVPSGIEFLSDIKISGIYQLTGTECADLPIGEYYDDLIGGFVPGTANNYGLLIVFAENGYYLQLYAPIDENTSSLTGSAYIRSLTDSYDGEWIQMANYFNILTNLLANNYLPLSGGTLTGALYNSHGSLYLKNAGIFGTAATDTAGAQWGVNVFDSNYDSNNRRTIYFDSKALRDDITNCLRLCSRIDGSFTSYRLYGEHNITKGTADLTAGTSSLNSGCIYLVYE